MDMTTRELRKDGAKIKLEGQPLRVLELLLSRPNEIITRDELKEILWPPGTFVDFEHSINAAVKRLRQTLRDSADAPRFVETLPGQGYRFMYPVSREPVASAVSRPGKQAATPIAIVLALFAVAVSAYYFRQRPPASRSEIRSLAVLPLKNLSGDPSHEYFADGMTEALVRNSRRFTR